MMAAHRRLAKKKMNVKINLFSLVFRLFPVGEELILDSCQSSVFSFFDCQATLSQCMSALVPVCVCQ